MGKSDYVIVRDVQEKIGLDFPNRDVVVKSLKTGDYSVLEYENQITVEFKSPADITGTCDQGTKRGKNNRARFERELQRMKNDGYIFYCIVIGGSRRDVWDHCHDLHKKLTDDYEEKKRKGVKCRPPMNPETRYKGVIGSLKAWRADFNVHHYFLKDRETAAKWIDEEIFYYFMRHREVSKDGAAINKEK